MNLAWQTRIYMVVVLSTVLFANVFDAWNGDWATTIIAVAAVTLLLDSFAIFFHRHPRTWEVIKWAIVLILLLALFLIGLKNN
ncbi:MAG: hypothetical protein HY842_19565 [Bacteroidetes bacterium]|nr:hypothetical protein [Bacteroidota bacterium]